MVASCGECEGLPKSGGNRILRQAVKKKGNNRMRIKVDKQNDALYFRLDESRIVESEEIQPGVVFDFDENSRVVGVEFLNISSRASQNELSSLQFQIA